MKRLVGRKNIRTVLSLAALAFAVGVTGNAQARGGTAKPPVRGLVAPFPTATLPDPVFSVAPALIHGLDVTGFIQDATVDASGCGGTIKVNGLNITVPCNTIVQMPANTFRWEDFVNGGPSLALNGVPVPYPSFEVSVVGNQVGTQLIAGLIYVSQQSLNGGSGYISRIDYATGNIEVDSGARDAGGLPINPVVLQINDPFGRFGRAQSPDPRFSVDDANPTIHAGTGYPMCVPRTDPASADDPLCPQKNRPLVGAAGGCRNFSVAGIAPPASGELSPPAAGQVYCSQYVMKAVTGTPVGVVPRGSTVATTAEQVAGPNDVDASQQAPFEVGDYITWSGTLFKNEAFLGGVVGGPDIISAHTIEASVGIYTQPFIQPSYISIGEFGVGTADPLATAANGAAQETQDRMFLETGTTDVKTPVDIYYLDVDPVTGVVHNRWVTPWEMTGECDNLVVPMPAACFGVSGGITTQNIGPQPQRARIRAVKAPTGLLSQPTRNVRVMVRSACAPTFTADQALLDACLAAKTPVANGLIAGQYQAPVFEYIFPENVAPGAPIVPFDMWHLPHLRNGEGPGAGPLTPAPW